MLIVETIAKIRRYYFVEGRSIKQITRDLRLSRNTVRKVIRNNTTEHRYERDGQPRPQLGDYLDRLSALLETDWTKPKRRRQTAIRLYEQLQAEGYQGAYDSVQRYVKDWRKKRRHRPEHVFIPLSFSPGDAYQFDWSHEDVILGGVAQRVKVAHFRLCHSRKFFVVAYPRESLEMVFDSHDRAFAFLGGTCRRGIYDNMSTAVDRILRGKERDFNRRFSQMCSHYLVEPVACTPASGWEKGQIEKQVQDIRRWLFTPRPRFTDFAELNDWLQDRCQALSETRKHPDDKSRTIEEVFQDEKGLLVLVGSPFRGYTENECRVSNTSLVHYDRNHYSVECRAAGEAATVRATANRIQVVWDGEVVADHERRFGRDKTIYDPWHYLGVLQRKPGALRDGAPFQQWQLPPSLLRIQKRLMRQPGGDRDFVDILYASKVHGLEIAETACREALDQGTVQSQTILNRIARAMDPPAMVLITPPRKLQLTEEPVADCGRYDRLRQEVTHATT
ncbi:MAG: IS21 family transposase [Proteobacteria bacterium]|nr:IS21 family transposase [Pseudomonadota bacterium]MBU1686146.1 IS21 family transposase [Pseudomonadota bacterium]